MGRQIFLPEQVLDDSQLTDGERRLLMAIYFFKDSRTDKLLIRYDKLAAKARISDLKQVSKISKRLAEKGWIQKKRRGFTGLVTFTVTIPDRLRDDSTFHEGQEVVETTTRDDHRPRLELVKNTPALTQKTLDYGDRKGVGNATSRASPVVESTTNMMVVGNTTSGGSPVVETTTNRLLFSLSLDNKNIFTLSEAGWFLTEEVLQWVRFNRMDLLPVIDQVVDAFVAHHESLGSTRVDWDAAFRKWVIDERRTGGQLRC